MSSCWCGSRRWRYAGLSSESPHPSPRQPTRTRWKARHENYTGVFSASRNARRSRSPPMISKMPMMTNQIPSRTAITFSDPVGWKLTMSPRIRVAAPRDSVACQVAAIIPGADDGVPYSSLTTGTPFPFFRAQGALAGADVRRACQQAASPAAGDKRSRRPAGPVLARVVGRYRLAAVAADAQALAREREQSGLGLDPALADLLVPVVQGKDPGGHVRRVLPVLVERRGQDQVLPGRDVLSADDRLLRHANEVVDVMQPVVLDIQGVPAEP